MSTPKGPMNTSACKSLALGLARHREICADPECTVDMQERLAEALRKLRNEVCAMLEIVRPEMVEAYSLTNVRCMELRQREAETTLAAYDAAQAQPLETECHMCRGWGSGCLICGGSGLSAATKEDDAKPSETQESGELGRCMTVDHQVFPHWERSTCLQWRAGERKPAPGAAPHAG